MLKKLSMSILLCVIPILGYTMPDSLNTRTYHYSSGEIGETGFMLNPGRTIDYPTQIVRISGNLKHANLDCDEVINTIDNLFTRKVQAMQFYFNIYVSCKFNPQTEIAEEFTIQSYYDPMSDDAIKDSNQLKVELEHLDVYGTAFRIEEAKGLAVSLTSLAGKMEKISDVNYMLMRQDTQSHYFSGFYELINEFGSDVNSRFFGKNNKDLLAFFDKWIYPGAGIAYGHSLTLSNYIQLQPAMLFIMDSPPNIFTSNLRYYPSKYCFDTPNERCL